MIIKNNFIFITLILFLYNLLLGINIFATGGIGGVHRDFEQNLDISADLNELGRCGNVTVVSSGVKSILDIPKTLEYLVSEKLMIKLESM